MNRMLLFLNVYFLISACQKEIHKTELTQVAIDYFAPENAQDGSFYVFQEQNTNQIDTLWVVGYTESGGVYDVCRDDTIPEFYQYRLESKTSDHLDYTMFLTTTCDGKKEKVSLQYNIGSFSFRCDLDNKECDFGSFYKQYETNSFLFDNVLCVERNQNRFNYKWAKGIGLIHIYIGINCSSYEYEEDWEVIDFKLKNNNEK